jgi:CheY-like chemotaxis protein
MEQSRKVMILDDQLVDVMEAEEHLDDGGYEIVTLSSPNGALSKIDFEEPDILMLNIQMERLNADDLVETLRSSPDYSDLVVVIYTDMEAEELQQYCIDNDINGYFCKSMDISQIAEFLDNFFEYE